MPIPQERIDELRKKYPHLFQDTPAPAPSAAPTPAPAPVAAKPKAPPPAPVVAKPAPAPVASGPVPRPPITPTVVTRHQETAGRGSNVETISSASDLLTERERAIADQIAKLQASTNGTPLSDQALRDEAIRIVDEEKPLPIYAGGFSKFRYEAPILGVAAPQNIPAENPPSLMQALAPQTKSPDLMAEKASRAKTAATFDDAAFNASIADLPADEKRDRLDAYESFKAAFKKVRDLNPPESGVSDQDIISDLQRQLKALDSGDVKKFIDDPANKMGYTGDPLSRAFQRQVTTGTVPILEPGQMEFISTLDRIKRERAAKSSAATTEADLRSKGIEITRIEKRPTGDTGPGGKPLMEDVVVGTGKFRPATDDEIKAASEAASKYTMETDKLPWYVDPARRDEILGNIEGSAKGGYVFKKEYATGATVESPVSWFVRAITAVPNALTGEASEFFTPEPIAKNERAARPELYRDASAAVYNIAESRGLMGELGDLYEFAPDSYTIGGTPLKQYATLAKAAGFAGDLIGFDLGLIGGTVTGAREGVAAYKAVRELGGEVKVAEALGAAAKQGAKAGSAEFLSTIGLKSLADKVPLGDVRLQFGTALGDSYRAADEYADAFRLEENRGATPEEAHEAAVEAANDIAPKSKFVDDARKAGAEIMDAVEDGSYFQKSKEWEDFQRVSEAARNARRGKGLDVAGVTLKSYLSAAVRQSPEVRFLLEDLMDVAGYKTRVNLGKFFKEVNDLDPDVADNFYRAVIDTAATEKGFTTMDRATKGFDPGRFTVRLTPSTFTTASSLDSILQTVRDSNEYSLIKEITSTAPEYGTKSYKISEDQAAELGAIVRREAISSTLPRSTGAKILQEISDSKTISTDALRQIMYSVTDSIAENSGKTFKSSALAPTAEVTPVYGKAARPGLPVPATRGASFGENVGLMNSAWKKMSSIISDAVSKPGSVSKLLNPAQLEILQEGKRKINNISKILEAELKERPAGMSIPERIEELAGDPKSFDTWYRYAESSIYGLSDRSVADFILGNFNYKSPFDFLNGRGMDELQKVVAQFARNKTLRADGPQFIEAVMKIIEDNKNLSRSYVDGMGVTFALTKKPEEVLASTWARGRAKDIAEETIQRIIDFEPDTSPVLSTVMDILANYTGDKKSVDRFMGSIVAADLLGKDITQPKNVLSLSGVKAFMSAVDSKQAGLANAFIQNNFSRILDEAQATSAALRARYGSNSEALVSDMEMLLQGKTSLSEVGGPLGTLLGKAIREEFGNTAKFGSLLSEMGQLAELEAKGNLSAIRARKTVTSIMDSYNSFFYNMMLYMNPRFHGNNLITAPFMAYNMTGELMDPSSMISAVNVITNGSSEASRAVVVATDRFGVPITAGDLFDKAVMSGAFRSQARAALDPRFLVEARQMGIASGMIDRAGGKAEKIISYPAEFANMSDNVWRMSYVIKAIKDGKTVEEAMDIGRRSLFDYGAATAFERKYVARNILFYNFMRNNLIEGARLLLTNPSRVVRQIRLTNDITKMKVGEDKWNEMRWYTPYDAGVARIVLDFAPQANREGKITLLPNMPYYDFAYMMSGILTTPIDMMIGQPDPVSGRREFGSGWIFGKLSPYNQAIIAAVSGADALYDIRLKKNIAPVPHIAAADQVGALPGLVSLFNLKARDAEPGEAAYMGKVYEMTDQDFERYKSYMKFLSVLGTTRFVNDWSKWAATLGSGVATGQTAGTTVTVPSALGITSQYSVGIPEDVQKSTIESEVQAAKEKRLGTSPKK